MLHFGLRTPNAPLSSQDERLARLWAEPARCAELVQVAQILRERIHRVTTPAGVLRVHAHYSPTNAW